MQCKESALHSNRINNSEAMSLGEPSTTINASYFGEKVIGIEALEESLRKCKQGVLWKDSTAHFWLNSTQELEKLCEELHNNTYRPRPGRVFVSSSPKRREILSVPFRDRVFQRSLNDNLIYPEISRHLIYDNCACQKGKGTDFARERLKCHLQRFYRQHGLNGYILQCDIKGYYPSLRFEVVENLLHEYFSEEQSNELVKILRFQYGSKGFLPGSQLLQIMGISVLNGLDHYIKEKLKIKGYVRYMDDFLLIHPSKDYLETCRRQIQEELTGLGLELHPSKTKIFSTGESFRFMGFVYRLTDTGKVLMFVDPQLVKRTRRKIRHLLDNFQAQHEVIRIWRDYAGRGNSRKVLVLGEQR